MEKDPKNQEQQKKGGFVTSTPVSSGCCGDEADTCCEPASVEQNDNSCCG